MLVIDTDATLRRVLNQVTDPVLRQLLATRLDQLGGTIEDSARFLVVEPPDTLADAETALGFPLMIEGEPVWDVARLHRDRLVELVINLSDDGPADVLLVPLSDSIDASLTDLLRRHGALASDAERHTVA